MSSLHKCQCWALSNWRIIMLSGKVGWGVEQSGLVEGAPSPGGGLELARQGPFHPKPCYDSMKEKCREIQYRSRALEQFRS